MDDVIGADVGTSEGAGDKLSAGSMSTSMIDGGGGKDGVGAVP